MSNLLMITAWGEQHGLINTLTNSVPFDDFKSIDPKYKSRIEKEKKEDARIVRTEYLNSKGKHERLTKPYCRYAGDPIQTWHLIPGKVYDLPLGFIKEINEKKNMKRSGLLELDGKKVTEDGSPLSKDEEDDWVHKLVPVNF